MTLLNVKNNQIKLKNCENFEIKKNHTKSRWNMVTAKFNAQQII